MSKKKLLGESTVLSSI